MNDSVTILDLFSACPLSEDRRGVFSQALVLGADIDPDERRVAVRISAPVYLPSETLRQLRDEIVRAYGLGNLTLHCTYPPEALAGADHRDLCDVVCAVYPAARAILAGSRWDLSAEAVTIHLAANGKDQLEPYLPALQRHLQDHFGVSPTVTIEAHSALTGDALYAETARLREEAVKALPVQPAPKAASGGASHTVSAADGNSDLIFGRPFYGETTPLKDLELDMFKVVVQGEVFAVNHKELKKRNAWVICFDMTDYTGSVRINQFMEADKAKPILERIKTGMWISVQGRMTYDRYDNEMVMQPQGIMLGKKPGRVDRAAEKRVELHLHTRMSSMDALTDVGKVVA